MHTEKYMVVLVCDHCGGSGIIAARDASSMTTCQHCNGSGTRNMNLTRVVSINRIVE